MNLRDYLDHRGRGSGVALARALGVKPVMVSLWASGARPIPFERCVDIERATDGAVRRWDLCPRDWHRHWPELCESEGAPDVPEVQHAA